MPATHALVKITGIAGASALGASTALLAGLGVDGPAQVAWVLGGLTAIAAFIGVILIGRDKIARWMDRRAAVVADTKIAAHEKTDADKAKVDGEKVKALAIDAASAAGEKMAHELRLHTLREARTFDAISRQLDLHGAQNEAIMSAVGVTSVPKMKMPLLVSGEDAEEEPK